MMDVFISIGEFFAENNAEVLLPFLALFILVGGVLGMGLIVLFVQEVLQKIFKRSVVIPDTKKFKFDR